MINRTFLTGCDKNTEWMLPWFMSNFKKHNPNENLVIANFGMTQNMLEYIQKNTEYLIMPIGNNYPIAWCMKPAAFMECLTTHNEVMWIDTDCEVLGDISELFHYIPDVGICIAIDKPWTELRNEQWHNTGIFGAYTYNQLLITWEHNCRHGIGLEQHPNLPPPGDQDVLHKILVNNPIMMSYIHEIPNKFNFLRLQVDRGDKVDDVRVIHWTGAKGKEYIKGQI